jgi:hypothetical protein
MDVSPTEAVSLDQEIACPEKTARVSLHVESNGVDEGSLQEVRVEGETR